MQKAHILGAGGIGVVLGYHLARAGWSVTMVDAREEKVQAGRAHGLQVDGRSETRVAFQSFAEWQEPEGALLLLCTKTFDNAAALAKIRRRERLLPVQNGFDPLLEKSEHPCEGISSFVSQGERHRPCTRLTRSGELHLGGRRALSAEERTVPEELAAGLRAGGMPGVHVVPSVAGYKASKLMYNAAISPLAAAAGMDNEGLLSDPLAQRLFFALLRENYAILRRSGTPMARIGPFHPSVVNRILACPGLGRVMARFFRPGLRGTYCSMAPDMGSGQTEIAAYNGHLARLAEGQAPINAAVLRMMERMEGGGLPPQRARLVTLGEELGFSAEALA